MRKIPLGEGFPELADQLVDQSLRFELSSSDKRKVEWCCDKGHTWTAMVANRTNKGYGCPYCSGRLAIPGETDLATLYPDIAKELVDESLASTLKPTSHGKVEWKCENGHTWFISPAARVAKKSGCPYCSGRKAWKGESDLATTHPDLAAQLVDKTLATSIKAGTNKKVEWECPKCHHRWFATPNSRVHMGSGCPRCAGKCVVKGSNDLLTLRPDIAKEVVDQEIVKDLHVTSNRKVVFRCEKGHTWETSIGNRVQFGHGCPICAAAKHSSDSEKELADFVETLVGSDNVLTNVRSLLPNKQEVDILVPKYRIAIEYNGVYWHSVQEKGDAGYHVVKCDSVSSIGFTLIQIWEDMWKNNRNSVESYLRYVFDSCSDLESMTSVSLVSKDKALDFVSDWSLYPVSDFDFAIGGFVADAIHDLILVRYNSGDYSCCLEYISDRTCVVDFGGMLNQIKVVTESFGWVVKKYVGIMYRDTPDVSLWVSNGFSFLTIEDSVHYITSRDFGWKRTLVSDSIDDNDTFDIFDSGVIKYELLI